MTRLTGHFDGRVIVPDEPVNLPLDQKLIIQVEPANGSTPDGVPGDEVIRLARELRFDPAEVEEMNRLIEEGCERIDKDGW